MFVLMTVNVLCIKHAYQYSVVQIVVTESLYTAKRSLKTCGVQGYALLCTHFSSMCDNIGEQGYTIVQL